MAEVCERLEDFYIMQTVAGLSDQRPHLEKEEVPQQSDAARELKKVMIMLPASCTALPCSNYLCRLCISERISSVRYAI